MPAKDNLSISKTSPIDFADVSGAFLCGTTVAARIRLCGNTKISQQIAINMKYLVFTYYVGRSLGGMKDYLDCFESVEESLDNILVERNRYYQVVDRDTMKVVREGLAMFKNFVPEKFSSENPAPEE